jgi:heptaprenyl diphosphate synthase
MKITTGALMQLRDKYRIALLSAFALGIHGIESLFPSPVPWLRLGFANIITLATLVLYGMYPAIMVTLIRVILGSLFSGTFLGPAFLLSLVGGIASTLAMGLVLSAVPRLFSVVGLSIIGALFHNISQLIIAYFFFVQRIEAILLITPFIILLGTLTGTLNGFISEMLINNLKISAQTIQNVSQ